MLELHKKTIIDNDIIPSILLKKVIPMCTPPISVAFSYSAVAFKLYDLGRTGFIERDEVSISLAILLHTPIILK